MTVKHIGEEYRRLTSLHKDTTLIDFGGHNVAEVVELHPGPSTSKSPHQQQQIPSSVYQHHEAWHYVRSYTYKHNKCQRLRTTGHKDGYCLRTHPPKSRSPSYGQPVSKAMSIAAAYHISTRASREYIKLEIS
ncbi:unnamed protein product [Trichobilharzia regenti]|nr:unnamed protein product [Trichobilharzia regenti]